MMTSSNDDDQSIPKRDDEDDDDDRTRRELRHDPAHTSKVPSKRCIGHRVGGEGIAIRPPLIEARGRISATPIRCLERAEGRGGIGHRRRLTATPPDRAGGSQACMGAQGRRRGPRNAGIGRTPLPRSGLNLARLTPRLLEGEGRSCPTYYKDHYDEGVYAPLRGRRPPGMLAFELPPHGAQGAPQPPEIGRLLEGESCRAPKCTMLIDLVDFAGRVVECSISGDGSPLGSSSRQLDREARGTHAEPARRGYHRTGRRGVSRRASRPRPRSPQPRARSPRPRPPVRRSTPRTGARAC